MPDQTAHNRAGWPAPQVAAMVEADPVRDGAQTVEGPTLHDRETEFGRGLASFDRSPTCFGRSSRASALRVGPGPSLSSRLRRSALLIGALALLATGCGGGDDAAAVDPAATAAATPTTDANGAVVGGTGTAPAAATGDTGSTLGDDTATPGANEIAGANAAGGSPVTVTAITPKKFAKAHCIKPIIVVFYQPGSVVDQRLYAEAAAAAASVKGIVSLTFTPKDTKLYGDLPAKLGLLSTPGLAVVDRSGKLENFWVTYVDRALIRRSLQNAAAAKPCKVATDEAPAAGSALSDAALVANGGTVANTTANPLAGTEPGTAAVDAAGAPASTTGSPALDTAAAGAVAPTT
ncbi:MAG: hypothetical protein JWM86_2198 [Thermoleophilia bacterium]|nr:hypothetical protein [Thermoleophilia bacterium]